LVNRIKLKDIFKRLMVYSIGMEMVLMNWSKFVSGQKGLIRVQEFGSRNNGW
jgi:hypothetical protein